MAQYTFTRHNGEKFVIDVTVDLDKIAEDMAHSMARSGKQRATKAGGGIVAVVVA